MLALYRKNSATTSKCYWGWLFFLSAALKASSFWKIAELFRKTERKSNQNKLPIYDCLVVGNWLNGNWLNNHQLPITSYQLPNRRSKMGEL